MLDTVSKVNNTYVEYVRKDLLVGSIFRKEVLFGCYDMKSELDHYILFSVNSTVSTAKLPSLYKKSIIN